MSQGVMIRFEGPEDWVGQRESVDMILEKYTGTSQYPSTKTFPPMIMGAELNKDAIDELNALHGVIVHVLGDE